MSRTRSLSIRAKTTVFVVMTLGVLIGLIAVISFTSSLWRVEAIEDDHALEQLDRVNRQLDNSLADLGGTNSDWAWWDSSFNYLSGTDPDYVENNLYAEAFTPIGVDLIAFADNDGGIVYQAWFDDDGEQPIPEGLLDTIRPGGRFSDFTTDTRATPGGVIAADGSVFLVTSRAILQSDFGGEPPGIMIMARVIDAGFVTELAALTGLDLRLTPCSSADCAIPTLEPSIVKTASSISASGVVVAADGTSALHLQVDGPRDIYEQSIDGILSVLIVAIAVGVLAVLLTIAGLRRLVVGPLEELGATVAAVGRTNDPSLRANVDRRDEIGNLAADLNLMLTRLERSQNQLLDAKAEIEGASTAKSKFLSRVSHEVRTPLNGVLAYAQLLQLDDLEPDAADSVNQIVVAARHITQLVDEFLDIARIEAGAIPLTIETVDTTAVATEVIAITQPVAAEHGTSVMTTTTVPVAAAADTLRLRQVLLNLVSNAIKYGGTSHPVMIHIEERADRTFIVVKDHGPGIAADQIHRLFVPFDRLDADRGTKSGTGIGLSVTKQLVELMNGTIEVVSEQGTGTAFIVSLPAAASDSREQELTTTGSTVARA